MNHSRIKASVAALAVAALIGLSACGGSDGLSRADEEALQMEAAAAEEAKRQAEEARQAAEEAKRQAEEAQRQAEEEARQAEEAKRQAEEEAAEAERLRQQAERERLEAERERLEAERAEREAEQQRQREEEARQAAEAEQKRLQEEAERAQQRLDAAAAMRALAGSRTRGGDTLNAAPRYNAPASITAPTLTGTPSRSSAARWLKTTLSSRTTAMRDMIEIYSDVEAPKRSPFATSSYNSGSTVIDTTGMVIGSVTIANADGSGPGHSRLVASGSFPRTSGGPRPYTLVDRGPTQDEIDADPNDDITGTGRNTARHPLRYSVEVSGSLQGASGRFRCGGADTTTACTVQNRGGSFHFGGTWVFIPSSGTVQILSDDAEFMWFGWWSRYTASSDSWAFVADHGGNALSDVAAATGTATYRGTAAGHYAIAEPVGGTSGLGSFTASATLQADFDNETVSGSITGFSNASDWSLTLNSQPIASGAVAAEDDTVTWSINGNPAADSGAWDAAFYSNLPVAESTGVVPYGIAGTFQADYGSTAELIGAFGAHK